MQTILNRQIDHAKAQGWMPFFEASSQKHGVPLDLLLAVASRESNIGTSPLFVMYQGDNNNAVGIMQIDRRWHQDFTTSVRPNDHAANIDYGASLLATDYRRLKNWQYAASAYNAGPGRVAQAIAEGKNPDSLTTGGNYGADVMRRANYIKQILWPVPHQGAQADPISGGGGGFTHITNPARFEAAKGILLALIAAAGYYMYKRG
jgi:soluble lytic murein transglycosylase-like protein